MKSPVSARSKVFRLVLNALFIALFFVISTYLTVKLPTVELSLSSLPILLCAFLLGPVDALAVALCGSFLEQMMYGLTPTAPLWMLPVVLQALFAGILGWMIRKSPRLWKQMVIIVAAELLLNFANTYVLYLCGYIMAEIQSPVLIIVGFLTRTPVACVRAVLSCILIPLLLPPLRKFLKEKGIL